MIDKKFGGEGDRNRKYKTKFVYPYELVSMEVRLPTKTTHSQVLLLNVGTMALNFREVSSAQLWNVEIYPVVDLSSALSNDLRQQ